MNPEYGFMQNKYDNYYNYLFYTLGVVVQVSRHVSVVCLQSAAFFALIVACSVFNAKED